MMRQVKRFSSVGLVLFLSACAFGTAHADPLLPAGC